MKNEKLIIDGNAFYEIDMECIQKRKENEKKEADFGDKKKMGNRGFRERKGYKSK